MKRNLNVGEAQELILGQVSALPSETLPIDRARGRILAEEILSTRTLPPADCSAMDGYALAADDAAQAREAAPVSLQVVYEIAAGGSAPCALGRGEAARIFTGAPMPEGADSVVMQERVERIEDRLTLHRPVTRGDHVRIAGEELHVGDRVLEAGIEIRSPQVGLLASLGRSVVAVHRRPRVAIVSSGDELVEPDRDASGGRIVASNSYTLAAQCREIGAEPVYLGIARDRPEDLEAHLRAGLVADCIVTSAGVSVGDHDYVMGVLEKLGCQLLFWGVAMKPGHPLAFGRFDWGEASSGAGPLVFGLPGNPVSASVTFEQFVRPALRKMLGHRALYRPTLTARLATRLEKKPGRISFVRVQLERRDGEIWARSTGSQSSGVFLSMSRAQGLLVFPVGASELEEGASVTVQVLDENFFAGTTRGFDVD